MADHLGETLSAYLDDELDAAARAAAETHLAACAECRDALDDLRGLQQQARRWADDTARPAADLWAGIAARIDAPANTGARILPWYRRRWSVGIAELAVAASLVAAVTAGVMWRSAPASAPATPGLTAEPVLAELEPVGTPEGAVTTVSFADAQFDAAVADLERVLREQRDSLNPRTVQVLERNLQVIDDAITEARTALASDPANALLNAHLARARQRKLDLLRRAALITEGV
jgi:negative regulator of sigma E activity